MQQRWRGGTAAAVLLALLLAACGGSGPARAPLPEPEPAPPPAVVESPAPAEPAPPPEWAPGVPHGAGPPPMGRLDLRKLVTVPPGSVLMTGPGDWYARHGGELPASLPYGVLWDGWLGLRLERGLGWIPAAGRIAMTDADGEGAHYIMEPGRFWSMEAPDGFRLEVSRPGPGVFRVEASGAPAVASLTAYPEDDALYISFGSYQPRRSRIDPGEDGFWNLSAGPRGLLLEFASLPSVRILANEPGRLALELRPALLNAVLRAEGGSLVLSLATQGYAPPIVERAGERVTLRLQGARPGPGLLPGPLHALPEAAGMLPSLPSLREADGSLTIELATGRPHRVRLRTAGFDLILHSPGLAGKRVVIDPGHGGTDTGTATPWGLQEKMLTLEAARAIARRLEEAGAEVLLLRHDDGPAAVPEPLRAAGWNPLTPQWDIRTRAVIANWWGADALLSVHYNGNPNPGATGTEVYWHTSNLNADRSRELAELTQRELVSALGTIHRGVFQRPLGMVRLPHAPAVLLELGFLTNQEEARYMVSVEAHERAARGLLRALELFFAER
jgi:N-acetylmuramoyl-L-alanine amidase